jgi:hypothetical protein
MSFVYGLLVMKTQLPPYQILKDFYHDITKAMSMPMPTAEEGSLRDLFPKEGSLGDLFPQIVRFDSIHGFPAVDVARLISATLSRSLDLRQNLKDKTILPKEIISISMIERSPLRSEIITKVYGITNKAILSKTDTRKASCLRIYIQGHGGNPFDFDYHNQLRELFLKKGCDFLSMSMLGLGLNSGSANFPINRPYWQNITLDPDKAEGHGNYAFYSDEKLPGYDPLSLFLTPHFYAIQSIVRGYEKVSLMGISGGGWYTVWLAALMPEIDTSISYAGGYPLQYHYQVPNSDWEERYSNVYRFVDYWELYTLSQIDEHGESTRKLTLVFNDKDSCCYSDPYASHFKGIADSILSLQANVIIDQSNSHSMNVPLVEALLE